MSKTLVIGTIAVVVGLFALGGFLLWLWISQPAFERGSIQQMPSTGPVIQSDRGVSEEKISIMLGKNKYYPDEQVRAKILNNSLEIISYKGSFWPDAVWQKKNQETWEDLEKLGSETLGDCKVILSGESIDILVYSHPAYPRPTQPGAYRLVLAYSNGPSCEIPKEDIISKEFRVVEKVEPVATFCRSKDLVAWEVFSFNASDDEVKEYAVVCGRGTTHSSGEFEYDRRYLYVLDKESSDARVLWDGDLLRLLVAREVYTPQIVDVDADGIEEIMISGFNWGSPPCPTSTMSEILYSAKYKDAFSIFKSSVSDVSSFSEECEYRSSTEFSANLENEEYRIFKEYLIKE